MPALSSRQLSQHLRDPHRVIPGGDASGGLGDPAEPENIENGCAFIGAALGDYEVSAPVGRRSAASAFGDVENDADGCPFELVAQGR